jgi:hypothetical protein
MYEIRPESIKTFIEDNSVRLPRFQRKQTWDEKKNFELCISVFKEFPIGVSILNVESDDAGSTTKWLLDGRQRRNALLKLWEDPEKVYEWARKWIKFKANDQPADVEKKFRDKITEYLEDDDLDVLAEDTDPEFVSDEDTLELFGLNDHEDAVASSKEGIEFLLEIIRLIHNKTPKYSGFTRPFDFTKHISDLPYVDGNQALNSRKLKSFIRNYKQHCSDEQLEVKQVDSFRKFMASRFRSDDRTRAKIDAQIDTNWEGILERIKILDRIEDLLTQSKIGLIELKNTRATDSQKIFNIINSKGTKLTAVEILSAKPSWNTPIRQPSALQSAAAETLYSRIGVKHDGVVKWDLPATILPRLVDAPFFFHFGGEESTGLDKQLTLGFKLLSGLYENGVRKEDIDKLSRTSQIDWGMDFDTLVSELNSFTKVLLSSSYFNFLKSWRSILAKVTSDAVALNFFLVMYKDWERKGKPVGSDTTTKRFQKNAFILIDQLFFEYVNRKWRGSSDAKIASNLAEIPTLPDVFTPIPSERWRLLLDDVFTNNSIDGTKISQPIIEPLLYHFYALSEISGPTGSDTIEVDHIIPQALFKSSTIPDSDIVVHNLYNLALLPKRINISKTNKRLVEITDPWLKNQIRQYEFIEESDFQTFSDLTNREQLKGLRVPYFMNALGQKRTYYLEN